MQLHSQSRRSFRGRWCHSSMSFLIVLATLVVSTIAGSYENKQYYQYKGPAAPLTSDGMVMDTPEVAHARAAHLAMRAETIARLRKAQNEYSMYENNDVSYMPEMMDAMDTVTQKRQRQMTLAQVGRDSGTMETAGMTQTNQARASSKASEFYDFDDYDGRKNFVYVAPVRVSYKHTPQTGYWGPWAPLGPDGRVIDTPEVVKAREAHMKAHVRAAAMIAQNELYY